jgi:hypothetical protein
MTKKKTSRRALGTRTNVHRSRTASTNQKAATLAWAGFADGRLDAGWRLFAREDVSPIYSVCRTRAFARQFFADVRRVEIRVVSKRSMRGRAATRDTP